jgi:hypothetical protein
LLCVSVSWIIRSDYLQGVPGPHGNPGLPGLPGPKVSGYYWESHNYPHISKAVFNF